MGTCEQAVPADGLVTSLAEHTLDSLQQGRELPSGAPYPGWHDVNAPLQLCAKTMQNARETAIAEARVGGLGGWGLSLKFESYPPLWQLGSP